ncbi:MAG: YraN family protein [Proteobacteria bacterium]|nr:YraN family protein [Pseudomonadota bacterium]MBU1714286.1 YraN family protein [Pseudomonadota bacterium]
MTRERLSLGRRGEELACAYLQSCGYKIIERNYRSRLGEIDLIAEEAGVLVFVEVKTRSNLNFGHPLEGIGPLKRRKIVVVAQEYLASTNRVDINCRFDAVSVLVEKGKDPEIEIVVNAFELK